MSIIDNIRENNRNKQLFLEKKQKLLQRCTMAQLEQLYTDYVQIDSAEANPDSIIGGLQAIQSQFKSMTGNNRQALVKKISEQMSLDALKAWANDHAIKNDDIT